MIVYAAAALVGLPVAAPQPEGTHLTGVALLTAPSFGYIVGFVAAAALVGWLAAHRWDRVVLRAVGAFLAGSVVIYAAGLPWLAVTVTSGLTPLLLGDLVKALLAGALLPMEWGGIGVLDARKQSRRVVPFPWP